MVWAWQILLLALSASLQTVLSNSPYTQPTDLEYGPYDTKVDFTRFAARLKRDFGFDAEVRTVPKVYVYSSEDFEEIVGLTVQGCKATSWELTMWGSEVMFHRYLAQASIRTTVPAEADFFYVPAYLRCMIASKVGSTSLTATLRSLLVKSPHFRMNGGEDHVFLFPSGGGPMTINNWQELIPNSIFLGPEAHYTDSARKAAKYGRYFNIHKDLLIPGVVARPPIFLELNKPMKDRTFLATYIGRDQERPTRVRLRELSVQYPNLINTVSVRGLLYAETLGNTKFCLIPRGQSSWTLRSFESFFAGCIPVFLSDHVRMPFESFMPYQNLTIKWPEAHISNKLIAYLQDLSEKHNGLLEQTRQHLTRYSCIFDYRAVDGACNPYVAMLWELSAKRKLFRHGPSLFWKLSGAFLDRNLRERSQWQTPFELPAEVM